MLLAAGKRDLAAVVKNALGAAGQEDAEPAGFDIEEDENAGLAAGVLDLEIRFVARPGIGGHDQLGGNAGSGAHRPFSTRARISSGSTGMTAP
jgi:hypothetical protein